MNSRPNPERKVGGGRSRMVTQQHVTPMMVNNNNVYYPARTWNEEWVGDSGSFAGGGRLFSSNSLCFEELGQPWHPGLPYTGGG